VTALVVCAKTILLPTVTQLVICVIASGEISYDAAEALATLSKLQGATLHYSQGVGYYKVVIVGQIPSETHPQAIADAVDAEIAQPTSQFRYLDLAVAPATAADVLTPTLLNGSTQQWSRRFFTSVFEVATA